MREKSEEIRASVMAALLTGQSVSQVAEQFNLGKATVSRWRKTLRSETLEQIGTEKRESLEGLLIDYVITNLKTLKAQSEIVRDPDYIKKQSASEIAVLHGVLADKSIRILSALEAVEEESGFVN